MTKSEESRVRFRLSIPIVLALYSIYACALAGWGMARGLPLAFVGFEISIFGVAMLVLTMLINIVELRRDALVLYRINVLPWNEIERVQPMNLLGLRYMKAYRAGRNWAWWIPLYLADEAGFRQALQEYAPEGNPLRESLRPES